MKYINLDYLERRTKSDPAMMMEMIALYLEQTVPLITAMKTAMDENDPDMLHKSVHKMIPSFSIMGIDPAFETLAKEIQEYAHVQKKTAGAAEMVSKLGTGCTQACLELEEQYNIIKRNSYGQSR